MSVQPFILCPCCGARIEIEARTVQAELPLGPIAFTEKKLDKPKSELVKSHDVDDDSFIRHSERSDRTTTSSLTVASCEEDLRPSSLSSLKKILGEREWRTNSDIWERYYKRCPRALNHAIEDWKLRTPDQQQTIKNRAAWLTDRYKRAESDIHKARKSA